MKLRNITLLAVLLTFGFVTHGCGDNGGASLPLSEVETKYTEAMCDKIMECPQNWVMSKMITNTQECIQLMTLMGGNMSDMFAYFTEAVEGGRAEYDGKQGMKCLDAIRKASCDDIFSSPGGPKECEDSFTGLLADGESCRADLECAGEWCDMRTSCPGECATAVPENGACGNREQCAWGLVCIDDVCVSDPGPLQEGDECGFGPMDCAYGLYCDYYGSNQCKVPGGEGDDCNGDFACQHDMMCLESGCKTVTVLYQAGDDCDPVNEAGVCDFFSGLTCLMQFGESLQGTECVEAPGQGETCLDMDNMQMAQCDMREQLYCDMGETNTCLPKKATGEECMDHDECLSGWCNNNNECAPDEEDECF